jgi:excisionase family DNA binding protein
VTADPLGPRYASYRDARRERDRAGISPNGGEEALAAALIELLAASPAAMARLLELLESQRPTSRDGGTPAYTVGSLAELLHVSPKVVRGAISRGELSAVKRGSRWIISADAVSRWAQLDEAARPARRRRGRPAANRPLGSAFALIAGADRAERPL